MTRHVVGRAAEVPQGGRLLTEADGKPIVIFNLGGEFFGLLDRCPHQGGSLSRGTTCGLLEASVPGDYRYTRQGEVLRCPWHGWEFDIRTGKSQSRPDRVKAKRYPVEIVSSAALEQDSGEVLAAETIDVGVDGDYIVIEL